MVNRKTQQRGAYSRKQCLFIGAWIPYNLMAIIDDFVRREDLDRSKLLRRALEEKLGRANREAA
jgi:hypothetical protein